MYDVFWSAWCVCDPEWIPRGRRVPLPSSKGDTVSDDPSWTWTEGGRKGGGTGVDVRSHRMKSREDHPDRCVERMCRRQRGVEPQCSRASPVETSGSLGELWVSTEDAPRVYPTRGRNGVCVRESV